MNNGQLPRLLQMKDTTDLLSLFGENSDVFSGHKKVTDIIGVDLNKYTQR